MGSLRLAAPALLNGPDKHKAESFIVSALWLPLSYLKRLRWGPPLTRGSRGCPLGQARPLRMTKLMSLLWMLALMCHGRPHATYMTCFPTLHSFLGGILSECCDLCIVNIYFWLCGTFTSIKSNSNRNILSPSVDLLG